MKEDEGRMGKQHLLSVVLVAGLLLSGCAVRTQFQGCVIRCPDMTKDPDQIEAEGQREVLQSTPFTGVLSRAPQVEGRTL